jgi:hypothetical protein
MIRVVLDRSALLAYAQLRGLAVGELIAMAQEDGGSLVGVPALSFVAAHSELAADERARLVRLATAVDGVTTILPLLGVDTVEVAELEDRLADPGLGHAVRESQKHSALLATYAGTAARKELPDDAVLDL